MRRALAALAIVTGCTGCGAGGGAAPPRGLVGPEPFAATVPRSFEMSFVWRMGRSIALSPIPPRLRVDARGRPVLLYGSVFVPLRGRGTAEALPPYRLDVGVSDAAWTEDGALLVVSDRSLGVALPEGFTRIADLPAADMQVVPAGPGQCWLFGGEGDFARRLYLYDRGGVVAPVVKTPAPIAAVAGDATSVVVATAGALLRVTPGDRTVLLHRGDEPIRAVAVAGQSGIFFATARGVFYLREGGASFRMLDEGADDLQIRDEELFVLFRDAGVLRGSPVSAFAAVGRRS